MSTCPHVMEPPSSRNDPMHTVLPFLKGAAHQTAGSQPAGGRDSGPPLAEKIRPACGPLGADGRPCSNCFHQTSCSSLAPGRKSGPSSSFALFGYHV